jgi:hypothetical protein
VERRIERPIADLENVARDLAEPDADGPAVQRLEGEDLEDQKIEGALDEVDGFDGRSP